MNEITINVAAPFQEDAESIRIDDELILLNPLRRLMADGNYEQVPGRLIVTAASLAAPSEREKK